MKDTVAKLAAVRRKWENNGSTLEFNKSEGELFQQFRLSHPDTWAEEWPQVQSQARTYSEDKAN